MCCEVTSKKPVVKFRSHNLVVSLLETKIQSFTVHEYEIDFCHITSMPSKLVSHSDPCTEPLRYASS